MSLNIGLLYTGLISAWLSFAGSRHSLTLPLGLGLLAILLFQCLPGRKYSISLLLTIGEMTLHSLLFKFELLSVFVFVSLLGPGRKYSISLLLTIGLLFKFKLLPMLV